MNSAPIIDQNNGTMDPAIVFCESGKRSVGIGEDGWAGVAIAPNPTNGRLVLSGLPEGALRFELLDAMVRSCAVGFEGNGSTRSIDLGSLPSGTYVLRVCGDEGCRAFRLVRE